MLALLLSIAAVLLSLGTAAKLSQIHNLLSDNELGEDNLREMREKRPLNLPNSRPPVTTGTSLKNVRDSKDNAVNARTSGEIIVDLSSQPLSPPSKGPRTLEMGRRFNQVDDGVYELEV